MTLPRYVNFLTTSIEPPATHTGDISSSECLPATIPFVFSMFTVSPHMLAVLTNTSVAHSKDSREVVYTAISSAN
jgi:hypothetical protein